jgi:hypothetical protein
MATNIRLRNLLSLHQAFELELLATGQSLGKLEQDFAKALDISASLWSQIKSGRTVGDKLARQVESKRSKPLGWLDQMHPETSVDPEEKKFIALCRVAWSTANRAEKNQLKRMVSLGK